MPRVPNYEAPQVISDPLPGVRQSPRDFLSVSNQEVQASAVAVLQKMQQQNEMDETLRADMALSDSYLQWEMQARQREGVNAKGVTEEATKWWDDNIRELKGKLNSNAAQRTFDQLAQRKKQQSVAQFGLHEMKHTKKSMEEAALSSIVSSVNLAARYVGTPLEGSALSAGKNDVLSKVKALSAVNGWSAEEYAVKEADALTNFHKQVLGNMMDAAPERARQYFELNKQEINGTEYDSINKALAVGAGKAEAQKLADYAASQGMTQQQGLAYIRENAPLGDTRDIAETEWMQRFQLDRLAREGLQKDYADKAWSTFARTGKLSSIPSEVRTGMDGKDWEALKAHARGLASGTSASVKTDPALWLDLHTRIVQGEKIDLRPYLSKLSKADLEEFAKMQNKPASELKDAATLSEQLGNAHDMLGFGEKDKESRGLFDKAVADAVQQEALTRGKTLNYDERQKVIDRMMLEGRVSREWWMDKTGRAYEFVGTEYAPRFVPDDKEAAKNYVPEKERSKITAALTRAKMPVTEENIIKLYRRKNP